MIITKEIHVHAGHVVSSQIDAFGDPGKCARMGHGHTYRIIASVDGSVITDDKPSGGMVIDFGDLKSLLVSTIYDEADHAFYIWEKDSGVEAMKLFANSKDKDPSKLHITSFIPTAENLAKHWFKNLERALIEKGIKLYSLEVFETPTSSAIYSPEEK
jgi:6-pyruvoyltetrahydropterin/6-carboxytetrahydropterin synthase